MSHAGLVGHIRLDNGPEFTAKAIRDWLDRLRVKTLFIEPGVAMPYRGGIHCIRRSVVTVLYCKTDLKEVPIRKFLRWSLGGRDLGVMPRYVKTPAEVSDLEVLAKHPYAAMWKMMMPFLSYLLQYEFCVQFINIERN